MYSLCPASSTILSPPLLRLACTLGILTAARLRLKDHPRTVYITAPAKNGLYLLDIPSKAKVPKVESKANVASEANLADSKADSKAHSELVYEVHRKLGHLKWQGWRALGRSRD